MNRRCCYGSAYTSVCGNGRLPGEQSQDDRTEFSEANGYNYTVMGSEVGMEIRDSLNSRGYSHS